LEWIALNNILINKLKRRKKEGREGGKREKEKN
jgi:hypothetical protein